MITAGAYEEAGIGTNFLGVAHTLRKKREANYSAELDFVARCKASMSDAWYQAVTATGARAPITLDCAT